MRLTLLGAGGMLGRAVKVEAVKRGHDVEAVVHRRWNGDVADMPAVFDISEPGDIAKLSKSDAIINCTGIRPTGDPLDMILVNAVGPQLLARLRDERIYHVSTDCVFGGKFGPHNTATKPSPTDMYGLTKLCGEPQQANVVIVRTSFIGFEHGFLGWLIWNRGKRIRGWTRAIWSGSTVWEVARALLDIVESGRPDKLIHLFTKTPTNKFDLACCLNEALNLEMEIEPAPHPIIDRWVTPTIEVRPATSGACLEELVEKWQSR